VMAYYATRSSAPDLVQVRCRACLGERLSPLALVRENGRLLIIIGQGPLLQFAPEGETTLANLSGILKQLSKERAQVERQLSGLDAAIRAFASVYSGEKPVPTRRKLSAKGRARIAAAQRVRWAKVKRRKKAA
jgi:hypothetical protein